MKAKRSISLSLLNAAKEQERREKGRKEMARLLSKELLAFSGRLLDGGAACIGTEYVAVGGNGQMLQDVLLQGGKKHGFGGLKSWSGGFQLSGRNIVCEYGRTSTYGFDTNHFFMRLGKDLIGTEGDLFADVAWLLDETPLCSVYFYLDNKRRFKGICSKDLLGMFERFGGILEKKKAASMYVELRMQDNAKPSEARDFYNRLLSLKLGEEFEVKTHYDGVDLAKGRANPLSDDKKLFSVRLHGYSGGKYKPFLDANWDLCNKLYSRRRDGNAALDPDEVPNLGGVSLGFKLAAGKEYPEAVLDCADFVLSFFEGKCAYQRHKLGPQEFEHAMGLVFNLDR